MVASSPSARRRRTRSQLLGELRHRPVATRAELAAATGLSRSATAAGVTDLLAAGLIIEQRGADRSSGGRGKPSTFLTLARPAGHVLGIDFGHMHVRVALADTEGHVLGEEVAVVDVDTQADRAISTAGDLVDSVLRRARLDADALLAVAAGIPGPLDRGRRMVSSPTILNSWIGRDAADALSRQLGVPVVIDNDADIGAIGEKRYGAAQTFTDFIYIKASHGIGASIVIDGRCYRGSSGIAGEIGHTQLPGFTNRCRCGNQGCLESVISVPEVRRQLSSTHLCAGLDGHEPALTSVAADPVGARVLADAGRVIGRVVADGCNWFNPQAIILGGELGSSGTAFAEGFQQSIDRYALPSTAAAVTVRTAALGMRAEVMGAVAVAQEHCVAL